MRELRQLQSAFFTQQEGLALRRWQRGQTVLPRRLQGSLLPSCFSANSGAAVFQLGFVYVRQLQKTAMAAATTVVVQQSSVGNAIEEGFQRGAGFPAFALAGEGDPHVLVKLLAIRRIAALAHQKAIKRAAVTRVQLLEGTRVTALKGQH